MSVTISGTNGIDKVAANSVESGDIAAGAVSQTNLASGISGNGPAFSAYTSGSLWTDITNSTWTKLVLNAETFDTNGTFDVSNYRFTPTVAGYYQIQAGVSSNWSSAQYTVWSTAIYKNGSLYKQTDHVVQNSIHDYGTVSVQDIVYLNGSTDYVEIYVYSQGGTGPNYLQGAHRTYASGALVRAA